MSKPHIEEELLDRYAMGTLPGESIPEVEEHLLVCSFCQSRLVETDAFLVYFRAAATQVDAHPAPFWMRLRSAGRFLWGGSAVVTAALLLLLFSGWPRHTALQPAIVQMHSLRGPESQAQMSSGRPGRLIFDVSVLPSDTDYAIEIVDTAGSRILEAGASVKDAKLTFLVNELSTGAYWVRVYRTRPARELVAEYGLQAK